ncbi:hypothetical protein GCM10027596_13330 [Nocardioides korecus]
MAADGVLAAAPLAVVVAARFSTAGVAGLTACFVVAAAMAERSLSVRRCAPSAHVLGVRICGRSNPYKRDDPAQGRAGSPGRA